MMRGIDGRDISRDLDRYITGNYGEDQFRWKDFHGHETDLCDFFASLAMRFGYSWRQSGKESDGVDRGAQTERYAIDVDWAKGPLRGLLKW